MRVSRVRLTSAVVALALVSACGSTARLANQSVSGEDPFAVPGPSDIGGTGTSGGQNPSLTPGSPGYRPGTTGTTGTSGGSGTGLPGTSGTSGTSGTGGAGGRIPGGGRGVTDTTVKLGIGWFDLRALVVAGTALNGDHSADNAKLTSLKENAQAIVNELNRTGGLGGRKVIPVWYEYPVSTIFAGVAANQQEEQRMCSAFTEDDHVFAIVPLFSTYGVLTSCAAKHDTPVVATMNSDEPVDNARLAQVRHYWYSATWPTINRRDTAYVQAMARQGFARGAKDKLGVMTLIDPKNDRANKETFKPALAAAGYKVSKEYFFDGNTNWQSAALEFRNAGITHVAWSYAPTGISNFMTNSQNLTYKPHNFLASEMFIDGFYHSAPADQLKNATGVGWNPQGDLGPSWQNNVVNPGDRRCRRAARAGGITPDTQATMYCDGLFFLQAALRLAPSLSSAGLFAGVGALQSLTVPGTFADFFAGRNDGTAQVRDLRFDAGRSSFVYTGPFVAAPR